METMNNEVITMDTASENTELSTSIDEGRDTTGVDTAVGVGIIGGLAILGWEFVVKPLGKKGIAAGKSVLKKAKEKKAAKFAKKETEDDEELVEVEEN